MSSLGKFLPNEMNRQMAPGVLAVCVTAVGAILGFFAWGMSIGWLAVVAYVIALLGVVGGFGFIVYGWVRLFFRR